MKTFVRRDLVTYIVGVGDVDEYLILGDGAGDADAEGYSEIFGAGQLDGLLQRGVMPDVEKLRHQILIVAVAACEEERSSIGARQQTHVPQDLVTEDVDVELVGDVANQLHEELGLLHGLEVLSGTENGRVAANQPPLEEIRRGGGAPGGGRRDGILHPSAEVERGMLLEPLLDESAVRLEPLPRRH